MTRTLHLLYSDDHTILQVLDSDKTTELYSVDRRRSKPNLIVHRSDKVEIPITLNGTRVAIDIAFPEGNVQLAPSGRYDHEFSTSVLSGAWKASSVTSSLKLVDAAGSELAAFDKASLSASKQGTLEILRDVSQEELDVIVTTGLAMVQHEKRQGGGFVTALLAAVTGGQSGFKAGRGW